ncbi:peptide MFS transporter [Sphingomonas sp. CROZ-RG-20F-R02-07]|uniref:peptide MFS transporter n=1 Tax=Sphingomonas sp. CROZ-RG-20F-R02-07 TaxID=2914832 RepID=UPI001F58F895|nr:peptide MFS transporter [Sphingomonas sp. CROZ-RG-20F-R02-07]
MTDTRAWFGQPRGLTVLFLTNMWEQFSYYGMRALLVLYMTKALSFSDGWSSLVYGTYTGCAYLTPIVGGPIADRWLGKRRAIVIGASLMALGHFMMAFGPLLYLALATIAVGNGLFLPSLPSQVGDLYAPDDPRRSWAYNVYYVGINLGGFLAPFVCGTLAAVYGWHYGFGAAGIGMLAGLVIYLVGSRYLPPEPTRAPRKRDAPAPERGSFDRTTLLTLAGVALSVMVFRGAYEQVGNALNKWADTGVDRHLGRFVIDTTWFQALNPLFVMVMTPALLATWVRRAAAGHVQRAARRMATGALIVAAAYLLLAGVVWASGGGLAHWGWLFLFFVVFTFGELFILPTGLGLFARLAPAGRGATTVAAWFATIFAGSFGAGAVGTLWTRMPHGAYFALLALLAAIAAAMLWSTDALEQQAVRNRRAIAEAA